MSTHNRDQKPTTQNSSFPFRKATLKFCSPWARRADTLSGPLLNRQVQMKVTCMVGISTCPGQPDSTSFKPCLIVINSNCQKTVE